MSDDATTPEDLFRGSPQGLGIFRVIQETVSALGDTRVRVTRSQIAFGRRRGFAYVWRPGQYVNSDVPAVLSIALPREVRSERFKEVVHPSANVWMHHIELQDSADVDDQIVEWLTEAYSSAR